MPFSPLTPELKGLINARPLPPQAPPNPLAGGPTQVTPRMYQKGNPTYDTILQTLADRQLGHLPQSQDELNTLQREQQSILDGEPTNYFNPSPKQGEANPRFNAPLGDQRVKQALLKGLKQSTVAILD